MTHTFHPDYNDRQVMLTLALSSYTGLAVHRRADVAEHSLAELLQTRALNELPPLADNWELVWGPAVYKFGIGFMDSLMFVARHTGGAPDDPPRYAVVIRGTNPVSAFSWILQDLWVGRQVDWPYAAIDTKPKVSIGTWLGLSILQGMRCRIACPEEAMAPFAFGDEDLHPATETEDDVVGGPLLQHLLHLPEPLTKLSRGTLEGMQTQLRGYLDRIAESERRLEQLATDNFVTRTLHDWEQRSVEMRREFWDRVLDMGNHAAYALLEVLRSAANDYRPTAGFSLKEFLADEVARNDKGMRVYVTGHSLGGVLASTTALWLADTQGIMSVAPQDQWDPNRKAGVFSYAFAGPTGGNRAYAEHHNTLMGSRYRRIANRNDIVTRAWQLSDLELIPKLYEPICKTSVFKPLVNRIVRATQELDYQHTRQDSYSFEAPIAENKKLLTQQIVHQHLDAYMVGLGLEGHFDIYKLFAETLLAPTPTTSLSRRVDPASP